ncbi:type II toxin-antitoxin system HicA family toxin [Nodularia chucula]|uniref:type II toxin-antitoxin system HicA family toxin n=1 Tax=Nodularia chucula TaxID=3093667 RepID=UPI0039C69E2C
MNLNSKQQSILNAISENPVRANIPWKDIESMLIALGAEKGSRVRFALNGIRATFHRPHPEKETDKGAVKSVRRFLIEAEVVKNDEV